MVIRRTTSSCSATSAASGSRGSLSAMRRTVRTKSRRVKKRLRSQSRASSISLRTLATLRVPWNWVRQTASKSVAAHASSISSAMVARLARARSASSRSRTAPSAAACSGRSAKPSAARKRGAVLVRRPGEAPEGVVVEREERRAERGGERHAVLGIEDGGEQAHDVTHLLALEEAAPLDDVVRQLAPAERVLVRLHLGEGAQEDGDVAVADAVLGVQALDDARQHARLQLARLGRPQLALVVLADEGDEPHRRRRAGGAAVREEALPRVEAGPVARVAARRHP